MKNKLVFVFGSLVGFVLCLLVISQQAVQGYDTDQQSNKMEDRIKRLESLAKENQWKLIKHRSTLKNHEGWIKKNWERIPDDKPSELILKRIDQLHAKVHQYETWIIKNLSTIQKNSRSLNKLQKVFKKITSLKEELTDHSNQSQLKRRKSSVEIINNKRVLEAKEKIYQKTLMLNKKELSELKEQIKLHKEMIIKNLERIHSVRRKMKNKSIKVQNK